MTTITAVGGQDAFDDGDVFARLAEPGTVDADAPTARVLGSWWDAVMAGPGPVPALPESVRRFVPRGEEQPPLHRWRIVDGNVLERWEAIERKVNSRDLATIALIAGNDRVLCWHVTRLPMPRSAKVARLEIRAGVVVWLDALGRVIEEPRTMTGTELREHVLSLQLAPEDDATYNGYYPTLPGNDIAHYDERAYDAAHRGLDVRRNDMAEHQGGAAMRKANPDPNDPTDDGYVRGGREIRGGRAEHREATKGMIHMGPGFQRDVDRIAAEKEAKRKAEGRLKIEMTLRAGPENPMDV